MKPFLPWWLSLVAALAPVRFAQAEDHRGIPPDAEIEAAVAQLEDKQTRLAALEKLIPLAGYGVKDPESEEDKTVLREAATAVSRRRDFETIEMALGSCSLVLQHWGLRGFPQYPDDPGERPGNWRLLLPRVRQLAASPDATARGVAQNRLCHYEGQREFLTQLVQTEVTAAHVMRLLCHLDRSTYHERMNPHVLRILGHKEEEVRRDAMIYIGFDGHRAPMWQFRFDDQVLARVLELSRSPGAEERSSAVYALQHWQDRDFPSVRARLFELARDPSQDVRRLVPLALRGQLPREDVRAELARLVEDESPLVCYFAILVLGPEKYEPKLRELADGADTLVAEFAAGQLKKLASRKNSM